MGKINVLGSEKDPIKQSDIFEEIQAPFTWSGTDHVYFQNSVYFVRFNTTTIVKYDIKENRLKKVKPLEDAVNNISGSDCQFEKNHLSSTISLKVDETGLWVLFCTQHSNGLVVLGKLDHVSLEIRRKYPTNLRKVWLEQTFISCGVLYGIRRYTNNQNQDEHLIKYVYNTHSLSSTQIYLPLHLNLEEIKDKTIKVMGRITSLNFIPKFGHEDQIESSLLLIWDEFGSLFEFELNYGFYEYVDFINYHEKIRLKYLPG